MYIVISCLGMPFNGETIKNKSLGGSESACYYMAKELAAAGHNVTVFTTEPGQSESDGVRYIWCGEISEENPLGFQFHFYAGNTPHDVCIIQRHPQAFAFNCNAKVKLWWLHDLATLRLQHAVHQMLWNIDGIITVSEFHKNQICETWEISKDFVHPVINAVDGSLFEDHDVAKEPNSLIYISRPERGLEHLVAPGGIMERCPDFKLYVCGYDNTVPQMRDYYQHLWQRCEELPNVVNLGHLTKSALAQKMLSVEALVYPTPGPQQPNFEEVSCIAVMEAMHAGLGIITTDAGALPETLSKAWTYTVPVDKKTHLPNLEQFVDAINNRRWSVPSKEQQHKAADYYTWQNACGQLQAVIDGLFVHGKALATETDQMRYLLDVSDIAVAQHMPLEGTTLIESMNKELAECYGFYFFDKFDEHYQNYYEYEKTRGVDYGPETLDGNDRFEHISRMVSDLPDCHIVGDYGCAHGHYTINLAKRFPDKKFIGYDITASNIEKAKAWAASENITNVEFFQFDALSEQPENYLYSGHDAMLVCEVLEHVADPQGLIEALAPAVGGRFICSTPFGPWEQIGYKEHWPWRAHIHHFERADITDIYGKQKNFALATIACGTDAFGRQIGSFVYSFELTEPLGEIDYDRKLEQTVPWQTVALCTIVKDGGKTIESCLDSCKEIIHEVVIGLDETTTDDSQKRIEDFCVAHHIPCRFFPIESPLKTGFDAARNSVVKEVCASWVLWLDADEVLINAQNIPKYLRHNCYNGYGLPQHHFTMDPPGILKTDLPVKLFRNFKGIQFFGMVHEHPEQNLNEGVGDVYVLPDVTIGHIGYVTERIRRGRFHRNIGLLEQDRKKYPERFLGKFLYLRDLAQMCGYDAERRIQIPPEELTRRIETGIQLWLELFDTGHLRLVIDALPFYSHLSLLTGKSTKFSFNIDLGKNTQTELKKQHEINANFRCREHFDKLVAAIIDEKSKHFGTKYA